MIFSMAGHVLTLFESSLLAGLPSIVVVSKHIIFFTKQNMNTNIHTNIL